MITQSPVIYKPEVIKKYSSNWKSNYIDLGHSWAPLDFIGTVQNQHFFENALHGDLYINPNTRNGEDTITLIDCGILNSLSVEMMTDDSWDSDSQMKCANELEFMGVAICGPQPGPACKDTRIQ